MSTQLSQSVKTLIASKPKSTKRVARPMGAGRVLNVGFSQEVSNAMFNGGYKFIFEGQPRNGEFLTRMRETAVDLCEKMLAEELASAQAKK